MTKFIRSLILCLTMTVSFAALAQTDGYLKIEKNSSSEGAHVYVDGTFYTTVPSTVAISPGQHKIVVKKDYYHDWETVVTVKSDAHCTITPQLEKNYGTVKISASPTVDLYIDGEYLSRGSWEGKLLCGTYEIDARRKNCQPYKKSIVVGTSAIDERIPFLQQYKGSLTITSTVPGAQVYINDKMNIGKTPVRNYPLAVGDYKVRVEGGSASTEEAMVSIAAGKTSTVHLDNKAQGILKVDANVGEYTMSVDGQMYSGSEQPLLTSGTYEVEVFADEHKSKKKKVDITTGVNNQYFKLPRYIYGQGFLDYSGLYASLGYQALRTPGLEIVLGGYLLNINMELNFDIGFKSEDVYYMTDGESSFYSYRPTSWNLKFGYGFALGTRMMATPQIGFGSTSLKGNFKEGLELDEEYSKIPCGFFDAGLRFEVALIDWISIYVNPSYTLPLKRSELINSLELVNPRIGQFIKGFNVNAGVSFNLGF